MKKKLVWLQNLTIINARGNEPLWFDILLYVIWYMLKKLFSSQLTNQPIILQFLSLAFLSSLVKHLLIRSEPNRVRHIPSAPLLSRLLAVPAKNRLGLKGMQEPSTLTYWAHLYVTKNKVLWNWTLSIKSHWWNLAVRMKSYMTL